jgi:hypothetical protein
VNAADLKPGAVLYVRAKPGLPNGVRSRGGRVFSDSSDTKLTVVPNGIVTKGDEIPLKAADLILTDTALTVTDQAPYSLADAVADSLVDIAARDAEIAKLREENAALTAQLAAAVAK